MTIWLSFNYECGFNNLLTKLTLKNQRQLLLLKVPKVSEK